LLQLPITGRKKKKKKEEGGRRKDASGRWLAFHPGLFACPSQVVILRTFCYPGATIDAKHCSYALRDARRKNLLLQHSIVNLAILTITGHFVLRVDDLVGDCDDSVHG